MPFLHCHAHLWGGEREEGGREEPWGEGGCEWNVAMDDDEMIYFLHFLQEDIS